MAHLSEQVIDPRELDDQSPTQVDQAVGLDGREGEIAAVGELRPSGVGQRTTLDAVPLAFGPYEELLVAWAGAFRRVLR